VSLARRALAAAQGDVLAADHAPAHTIITKAASIDLQNGIGGGNLFSQKRIDKSIGVDWTWERGNKRELRTASAQRSARGAGRY
jgi:cobalt-zinc-cadmium efflux system outer membrane protein